ncbi:TPA: hypothetical protein N0F65_000390 [Lagenidium giganteum]|uniref:Peptidase M13 C-terminal domain-containing protein n=1 Tax=Lagenidium giganteum TaxID=4803 RepID=A0AAV2Z240_9STRA|nr:TPA: hypothetical protein N0F65_000390 [Lagenidium giganteum]
MSGATVNAYYSPLNNQIVLPIGILQSPFFDSSFPAAENLSAIGSFFGRELTHAFDSSGRMFDGDGNQNARWRQQPSSSAEPTACARTTVNGNNTIGENIADNGGIKLALEAYHTYVRDLPAPQNIKNDKRFFVSFAQNWSAKYRDEEVKKMVATSAHTPHMWRARGAVMNSAAFATTFQCAPNKVEIRAPCVRVADVPKHDANREMREGPTQVRELWVGERLQKTRDNKQKVHKSSQCV